MSDEFSLFISIYFGAVASLLMIFLCDPELQSMCEVWALQINHWSPFWRGAINSHSRVSRSCVMTAVLLGERQHRQLNCFVFAVLLIDRSNEWRSRQVSICKHMFLRPFLCCGNEACACPSVSTVTEFCKTQSAVNLMKRMHISVLASGPYCLHPIAALQLAFGILLC